MAGGTTRSLGRLTLDLIAEVGGFISGMTQAQRQAAQSQQDIQARMDKLRDGIKNAFAGLALGALVKSGFDELNQIIDKAVETERFAKLSNVTTEEFQKMAFAAKASGIEMDKFSDITKDVQDKIGDFIENDAGPMKDFFTNIAPLVGVTINDFKRLSGPEALQLYISSLEKAGVSQQEMIFYLEALASDSSLLLPIFADNGAEIKRLGEEYARTGAIMSDEMIAAAKQAKAEMALFEAQVDGFKNTIAQQLIPYLIDLSKEFVDAEGKMDGASVAADTLEAGINILVGSIMIGTGIIQAATAAIFTWVSSIELAYAKITRNADAVAQAEAQIAVALEQRDEALDLTTKGYERLTAEIGKSERERKAAAEKEKKDNEEKRQKQELVNKALDFSRQIARAEAKIKEDQAKADKKLQDQLDSRMASMRQEGALIGKNSELAKAEYEVREGDLKALTEEQKKEYLAVARAKDEQKAKEDAAKKAAAAGKKAASEAAAAAKKEAAELKRLNDQYNDAIYNLEKRIALAGKDSEAEALAYDIAHGKLKDYSKTQQDLWLLRTKEAEKAEKDAEKQKEADEERKKKAEDEKKEYEDMIKRADEIAKDHEFEIQLLGKTRDEVEQLSLARELDKVKGTEQYDAAIESLKRLQEEYKKTHDQIEFMDELRSTGSNFFKDLADGSKSFKDSMIDALDSIKAKLLQMIADRLIEQLLGEKGTTGGGWLGGLFNQGGGAGASGGAAGGASGGGWFSNLFSSMFARASGGSVSGNNMYRVNENGMEMLSVSGRDYLLTGNNSGTITPAHMVRGQGGISQNNNFILQGKVDRRTQEQIAMTTGRKLNQAQVRNT